MNPKPHSGRIGRWFVLFLKWIIVPLGILAVLFIGVLTTCEIRREIPTPVIVKHLSEGSVNSDN